MDNPAKAGYWHKIGERYYHCCLEIIHWPKANITEKIIHLNKINDSIFSTRPYDTLSLGLLTDSDSIIVKSIVLNHLNDQLNNLENLSNSVFCGVKIPEIKPMRFNFGDSSLVIIQSNFVVDNSEYQVRLLNPENSKFISQYSLGYFISANNIESNFTSGEVEFINKSSFGGFKLAFDNDTTYSIR